MALRLLEPHAKLRRVMMEGVAPADGVEGDGDDLFLGVDLSEYYEGIDFASAMRIVVSQLKYSTRHPLRAWTVSRLCTGGRGQTPVITRLADIFKGFLRHSSRADVLGKLQLRLVSNQPVEDDLAAVLRVAQAHLQVAGVDRAVPMAKVLKGVSPEHRGLLRNLQARSGLASSQFTDFLRVLDFSNCGEEPRTFQRLRLIQELGGKVSTDPAAHLRRLCELIANEALPERSRSVGLSAEDVLACLEVKHPDDLFPAPPHLLLPERVMETEDLASLATTIVHSKSGFILTHGTAGVGKTTTVQVLDRALPPGSVVVIFDCFGGGSYLEFGGQRHTQRRVFLQLTNELAMKVGTPFLLHASHEAAELQRRFRRALEAAAEIVAGTPDALLVVVIDAADNAMIAADQARETSFVPSLWKLPLPSNCRIVVTARTHRRDQLMSPASVEQHALQGFDLAASSAHLRSAFPAARPDHCAAFHRVTGGTPRAQRYLLERMKRENDAADPLERLLDAPRSTLIDMFDDLWDAAVTHTADPDIARRHIAILMCLARPASLSRFAETSGLRGEAAKDFSNALVPGLVIETDTVAFRDEDFETYLREKLTDDEIVAAHDQLASYYLPRAERDEYAARYVADHLLAAGRLDDAITFALQGPEPRIIEDNLVRLEITRQRIVSGLKASQKLGIGNPATRLVLLAAEAAQSDHAVTMLVRENPELVAAFGDVESVTRRFMRAEQNPWLGSAHLRIAAMFARHEHERERALKHLRAAEAWIRRWSALSKNERYHWRIEITDIAYGAEAVYWVEGVAAAVTWLRGWRPIRVVLEAAQHLATSLCAQLSEEQIGQHLRAVELPYPASAAILAAVWDAGKSPPRDFVGAILDRVVHAVEQKQLPRGREISCAVPFCELAAALRLPPAGILQIADACSPTLPTGIPSEYDSLSDYDLPLRAVCLRAALNNQDIIVSELLPEKYRENDPKTYDPYSGERRQFDETVGKVLQVYKARARAIVMPLAVADVADEIKAGIATRREEAGRRFVRFDRQFKPWAVRASEMLTHCDGDAELLLQEIADLTELKVRAAAPDVWIEMAGVLVRSDTYRAFALLLLERAADQVTAAPRSGTDRWQTLLGCAAVAAHYDRRICEDYYRRGLHAAEGIDDDTALLLEFQADLARIVRAQIEPVERYRTSMRLSRLAEVHEDYVSERSRIPWKSVLATVTALDTPGGFALCSRWDDENRLQLHEGIMIVAHVAAEDGFLDPLERLALVRLGGEHRDVSKDALPVLDRLDAAGPAARPRLVRALRLASDWIRRDVPLGSRQRAAEQVIRWADDHGVGHQPGISELRTLVAYAHQLPSNRETNAYPTLRHDPDREKRIKEVAGSARHAWPQDIDEQLRTLQENYADSQTMIDYLRMIGAHVKPSERVAFLDAIVSAARNNLLSFTIARVLRMFLDEWQRMPAIRDWAPKGLETFFVGSLHILLMDYEPDDDFAALLSSPALDPHAGAPLVLPALVAHIDTFGARSLYRIAGALAKLLVLSEGRDVLEWSLS